VTIVSNDEVIDIELVQCGEELCVERSKKGNKDLGMTLCLKPEETWSSQQHVLSRGVRNIALSNAI
jgi:hypothetical protein